MLWLGPAACSAGHEPMPPACTPTLETTVAFGAGTGNAEVSATALAREAGLMNRPALAADSGMLFVFPADQPVGPLAPGFWMKNTLIDLSIAFMDSTRRVIGVQEMVALDTLTFHRPDSPYRYALEMNKGWFTSRGVTSGATAAFSLSSCTIITP